MSIIENKRLEAAVVMRTLLVAVLSLLALTEMSDAAQSAPTDIPTVGRFATIMDPQGAMLSLITYAKKN
jgi:ABC-type transport system involved in cytochrome c biogenesis permease subunit